ncbi:HET-domain-containing protein [Lepidopterella palustris CBS 459.81]|uniref:HET-domain-containing protein n=1 Tax=Lepidopterella palustris CBS 459.81 TaxID=1314670 RepID=A0A8E2DZA5_9PEZI|nr:HET-domain-containing protein [Lepidopterella palustris CBS 459.81]
MAEGSVLVQTCHDPEEQRKLQKPTAKQIYHYKGLQERGWFRLLVVEPSPNPQYRISCSLLHRLIKESPDFEALSYTWGTDKAIAPILIDGGVLFVRSNLFRALRSLRFPTKRRILWIDALCINQTDNIERNSQVSQMADIYSGAKKVIVWLGEGNEHTDRGMNSLGEICPRAKSIKDRVFKEGGDHQQMYKEWNDLFRSFQARHDSDACFAGICALFCRDWWTRVWTVQEITLAREAQVQAGKKSLPWEYFEIFSNLFTLDVVSQSQDEWSEGHRNFRFYAMPLFIRADTIRVMRMKWWGNIEIPLSLMVEHTLARSATDPRDKIYAILGLINCGPRLSPDYSLSCKKVYIAAFRAMLEYFGDLRVYNHLQDSHLDREKELPSWVPDFMALTTGTIHSMTFINGASPNDPIESQAVSPLYSAASNTGSYITGGSFKEAFWRTITLDCKVVEYHQGLTLRDNPRDRRRRLDRADKLVPPQSLESEEKLIEALDRQAALAEGAQYSRRFFTTEKGYMGIGPSVAQTRDIICVLFGGEVPFVLRPVGNGRYKMVGQCYMHGIMDGEVIRGAIRGQFRYEDFVID